MTLSVSSHLLATNIFCTVLEEYLKYDLNLVLIDLLNPVLHAFKGVLISHVINYENSVGPSVITLRYRFKSILSSRVPLKF